MTKTEPKLPTKPMSYCNCGHIGDGPNSEHANVMHGNILAAHGHGECLVEDCNCRQFRWDRFI